MLYKRQYSECRSWWKPQSHSKYFVIVDMLPESFPADGCTSAFVLRVWAVWSSDQFCIAAVFFGMRNCTCCQMLRFCKLMLVVACFFFMISILDEDSRGEICNFQAIQTLQSSVITHTPPALTFKKLHLPGECIRMSDMILTISSSYFWKQL